MKQLMFVLVAVVMFMASGTAWATLADVTGNSYGWVSYNMCTAADPGSGKPPQVNWGSLGNATAWTPPLSQLGSQWGTSHFGSSGALKNYATGSTLAASLAITKSSGNYCGVYTNNGTDYGIDSSVTNPVFDDTLGSSLLSTVDGKSIWLFQGTGTLTFTFSGLDNSKKYDFAGMLFPIHTQGYGINYDNGTVVGQSAHSKVTLTTGTGFTNASVEAGVDAPAKTSDTMYLSYTQADRPLFTGITPVVGTIVFTVTGNYGNCPGGGWPVFSAIALGEQAPAAPAISLTANLGAVTKAFVNTNVTMGGTLSNTGAGNLAYAIANDATKNIAFTTDNTSPQTSVANGSPRTLSGIINTGGTAGLGKTWGIKETDATATNGPTQYAGGTIDVYNHTAAGLGAPSNDYQTIITGGTLNAVKVNLANLGTNISALDVAALGNLTGPSGPAAIAAGGNADYTATGFNTVAVNANKTLSVSLNAGDDQSITGKNALANLSQTVHYAVLGHANAALGTPSNDSQSVITGAGSLLNAVQLSLTDAGTDLSPLDVSTLSNLTGTTGSAVVACNGAGTYTATGFDLAGVGMGKTLPVSLYAGDQQTLSGHTVGLSQLSRNVTYNVLDHSNAEFKNVTGDASGTPTANALTLNFGVAPSGANSGHFDSFFDVWAEITTIGATAGLDLDLISSSGDTGVFTLYSGSTTFSNQTAGSGQHYDFRFNTNQLLGEYTATYLFKLSDENIPGASAPQSEVLTLTLHGEIIPEPSALALMGIGMLGLVRRRK